MNQLTGNMKGFSWGGFSAILVTALLFTALPLLTKNQPGSIGTGNPLSVFISTHRPPPPPLEGRDQPKAQKMMEKKIPEEIKKDPGVKPKIDMPIVAFGLNRNGTGRIEIGVVTQKGVTGSMRELAFNPDEVDRPPGYLRTFPALYPYLAKRDNIEGRVLLRFVVDLDGLAKEAEVVKAEPAGFFEEAALKAIERYEFKPAVKDGEAVICNAAMTISFVLD